MPIFGLTLITLGAMGDGIAGYAILNHTITIGLITHLAAVFIWINGMILLDKWGATPKPVAGISISKPSSQILMMAVMGLFLFPGIGTLGWTLASGMASLMRKPEMRATDDDETIAPDVSTQIRDTIHTSIPKAVVQPLVEIPYAADTKIKRAALSLICREPSPRAMSLVRNFLSDPDADVRALAAVAVSRLEAHFSETLKSLGEQSRLEPQNADYFAAIGHLYHEYAVEGNPASRHFYETQARKNLERAISLDPSDSDALLDLAEILADLGEYQKALDAVTRLLAIRPELSQCYLLGLEIALHEGDFNTVLSLAQQACRVLPADSELLPLMRWWLGAKIPDEGRSR